MRSYAVSPTLAAVLAATALTGAAVAVRTAPPGRFLFVVIAVVAGAEALRAVLFRPTLRADARGIEVVSGVSRHRIPWHLVQAVTPLGTPASGKALRRRSDALEIDLGDRLIVVPAYRLGTTAAEAASSLTELMTTVS
ncbi:MAG TPA: PH domain-containing protein [Frankiaceae bacterium]|jgi:hypothetical protein|nr:PH domain-containing protein [Frankiaceae bacterium]